MIIPKLKLGIMLTVPTMICSSCDSYTEPSEVRYRVDVVMREKGRLFKGRGVWSRGVSRPIVALANGINSKFSGDAIPVKLPEGRVGVVLLEYWTRLDRRIPTDAPIDNVGALPRLLFKPLLFESTGDEVDLNKNISKSQIPPIRVECRKDFLPTSINVGGDDYFDYSKGICFRIAYSKNAKDPGDLKILDPYCAYEDVSCPVHIVSITITKTAAPVTRQLNHVFPWLEVLLRKKDNLGRWPNGTIVPDSIWALRR